MEKNTFERIEKDPPREKYYRIERDDGSVSYPNLTPIQLDEIKEEVKLATSKSKTTKKRTAKIHPKAE